MQFPTEQHETFIIIPHTFAANRIYVSDPASITAAEITLKIACGTIDDDSLELAELGQKAAVGFQRLRVWLDAILDHIIFIDVDSDLIELQDKLTNTVMYVPGHPDDAMLAVLLHSKISAITDGLLDIYSIKLSATDTDNIERIYRNLDPNKAYPLPGIEYYKGKTTHDKPWWSRPTIDVCEYEKSEDEEDIILWQENDPLAEIGKGVLTSGEEADIIVFDQWKKPEK